MTASRFPELSFFPVLTAAKMREWEKSCFAGGAISERVIMESAGRAVAAAVAIDFPEGRVVACVGKGNNGGDAVVALRTLRAGGREVLAVEVGGAGKSAQLTHGWEIPTAPLTLETFCGAGVILDGILGTGASGPPRDPAAAAIGLINAAERPVLAIDGPSGVDLTTGAVTSQAVQAAVTVTFGAIKQGLLLHPGRRFAGRLLLAEVGFPPMDAGTADASVLTDEWAAARLPAIAPDAHKGAVGLVGIVAGGAGFGGAAVLTAMGALRAGCGGVRVLSAEVNRRTVNTAVPEAVFFDRTTDTQEALAPTHAVVIGPGIGTDDHALALTRSILGDYPSAILLDADALTLLSANPDLIDPVVARRCIITPHPGELARLLQAETAAVLADRFGSAREAAERYGCVVLAKGTPTLVAAPGELVLVAVTGHSGVATGGMGDTLGGMVAAFLALGTPPRDAAAIGIHFAGRAAEAAGRGRGLLPRDVADALPGVLIAGPSTRTMTAPFLFDLPAAL